MNIEESIVRYNLTIRYIPKIIYETYSINNHQKGNEIIKLLTNLKPDSQFVKELPEYYEILDNKVYRLLTRKAKVPKNAGKFLVQSCNHNDSSITWQKYFIGDTLEKAIQNYINFINEK